MNSERFNKLVDELRSASLDTLASKNAKYAAGDDRLHNFRAGAEVMGGTPAEAAWGYATKHLVALRDKIQRNDFRDRADLLEKCQDIINYICFIWCIGNEEADEYTQGGVENEPAERPCITYRAAVNHWRPQKTGPQFLDGVCGCPGHYFKGADETPCPNKMLCHDCWNQPYKGEELIPDGEQE